MVAALTAFIATSSFAFAQGAGNGTGVARAGAGSVKATGGVGMSGENSDTGITNPSRSGGEQACS